jgi:tetratricopeptide (TPR) repeat protein
MVRQALSIAESHQQDQTADAARGFASLGGILIAQKSYADARLWLGRSLTIREHLYGAGSAVAADTLMQIGLAYQREHRWQEAEQTYGQALRIYQQAPDVVKRALAMRCFADVLSARHKYGAAEELLGQAAAVLSPEPAHNAARCGGVQSEAEGAGSRIGRCAPGTNSAFNRVALARVHASLADLRAAQKRYAEAVPLYRQALDALEPAFGPENPQLLTILEAYARALRAGQDYATAAGIDMRTMKIRVSLTLRGQVSSFSDGLAPSAQ